MPAAETTAAEPRYRCPNHSRLVGPPLEPLKFSKHRIVLLYATINFSRHNLTVTMVILGSWYCSARKTRPHTEFQLIRSKLCLWMYVFTCSGENISVGQDKSVLKHKMY